MINAIPGGYAALHDPKRVFNCDESGFAVDANMGKVRKVLARKGTLNIFFIYQVHVSL
jgi:hypothetical protein